MSNYVRHQPCPKCHSKDNCAVYDDGHEWCFGCGYYKPPEWNLERAQQKEKGANIANAFDLDLSNILPGEAISWLKKYDITNEEIATSKCQYDKTRELLCFPLEEGGQITGYVCRNFGPTRHLRKYLFFGMRGLPPVIASQEADKNTGIFVEDMLSAIKVGRSYTALPVLSANIDAKALKWASERFKRVGVWLDRDMHGKASRIAFKGNLYGGGTFFPVYSQKDPKDYSTMEVVNLVTNSYLPFVGQ